ncbi:helix-turn-helix transcriptional regulator [Pseudomonas sp. D1-3]
MTIEINGWRGHLGMGLAPRELEATIHVVGGNTIKEIARAMGISPDTAKNRLEGARLKLGNQRNLRGLAVEALRRGIIAPLAVILLIGCGHNQQATTVRRPSVPRTYQQARIARQVDDICLAA